MKEHCKIHFLYSLNLISSKGWFLFFSIWRKAWPKIVSSLLCYLRFVTPNLPKLYRHEIRQFLTVEIIFISNTVKTKQNKEKKKKKSNQRKSISVIGKILVLCKHLLFKQHYKSFYCLCCCLTTLRRRVIVQPVFVKAKNR